MHSVIFLDDFLGSAYTNCGMSNHGYPEQIPVRVTTKMFREIKAIADREYISLSQAVRKLIREALEKK